MAVIRRRLMYIGKIYCKTGPDGGVVFVFC